ncbi:MAG: hypothetical protein U9Q33_10410 [Campylobacterota bacterium]|nr:hypothetical protein [Campylobacterota bacterium]
MPDIYFLIIIFIALEIFESNWQRSDSFYGLIKNNYTIYKKSILLFFLLNPTFYYSIYLSVTLNNFSILMSSIIIVKFIDISFRLHLMNKIDKDEDISNLIPMDIPMNILLRYMNVIIYPTLFLFALIKI